ncbi:MAG: arylsulfatase A-like enzyme [Planctomycetota bacterium]|jgi:arylsulfatase A-like enzyme
MQRLIPLALLIGLSTTLPGCSNQSQSPTNVILLLVDTMRADHFLDPEQRVDTPNLDSLAEDGVSFTKAFSHAPMTLPAHTSIFSSQLPDATGIVLNRQQVPERLPLLAEYLQSEGYATSAVVSIWTLGNRTGTYGIERGFEHYDRNYLGLLPPAPITQERMLPELRRLAALDQPFFLFAHYSDPHLPYNVHDDSVFRSATIKLDDGLIAELPISKMTLWEHEIILPPGPHVLDLSSEFPFRYDSDLGFDDSVVRLLPPQANDFVPGMRGSRSFRRIVTRWENLTDTPQPIQASLWLGEEPSHAEKLQRYPGEVEYVDGFVGELLNELKTLNLYDDSLILFTSDHGEALGEHDWWGHNQNLYDELLHIPLVLKLPIQHAKATALQSNASSIANHIDLAPTILDVLGLAPLPGQVGFSLVDDKRTSPPVNFAATHLPLAEGSSESAKRGDDLVSLRDQKYKLIYTRSSDRFEMIDLVKDPKELTDVFSSHGEERRAWQEQLRAAANRLDQIDFEAVLSGATEAERQSLSALGYADTPENE